jgi:transposase InsO family protein
MAELTLQLLDGLSLLPVILHPNHGGQFTSEEYQRFLEAHLITCSMIAWAVARTT